MTNSSTGIDQFNLLITVQFCMMLLTAISIGLISFELPKQAFKLGQ